MSVGVALDVAVEPVLVERPVRGVEEESDLLVGRGLGLLRGGRVSAAGDVLEGRVTKVEEPLVDGDPGAKVLEGVTGEVHDGEPLWLVEDADVSEAEECPACDGVVEVDDPEPVEDGEELDELADVADHGGTELAFCADFSGVELDLILGDSGEFAGCGDVVDVNVEGTLADGDEEGLCGRQECFWATSLNISRAEAARGDISERVRFMVSESFQGGSRKWILWK